MSETEHDNKIGVYFHVPFCRAPRCAYCDFYSTTADSGKMARWLEAAACECRLAREERFGGHWKVASVFFGGGTPSLLNPRQIKQLLDTVSSCWELAPAAEITVECNPEDLSREWAQGCLRAGVNRLSVGVQSFDPDYLAAIGRCRGPVKADEALRRAGEAGFRRLAADLILGGPGSSERLVLAGVERALELGVDHLSLYGYHLDPPAAGFGRSGFSPVDDDAWGGQYLAVCDLLHGQGWRHYEISNWAVADAALCAHNLFYWHRRPYLGLGPSAHSFGPGEYRTANKADLDAWLNAAEGSDFGSVREAEVLDETTVLFEKVMLGLGLDTGLELELLERAVGHGVQEKIELLVNKHHVQIQDGRLSLTDTGFLLYDTVACELLPEPGHAG